MSVSTSQLYLITSCEEPKEAWDVLKKHFERETLSNKLFLKKQYFQKEMSEGSSVDMHLKEMKELTDKLMQLNWCTHLWRRSGCYSSWKLASVILYCSHCSWGMCRCSDNGLCSTAADPSWTKTQNSGIEAWSPIWFSASGSSEAATPKVLGLWWSWAHSKILSKTEREVNVNAPSKDYYWRWSWIR